MDNKDKWYFKTWPLIVSFLVAGPFMLPLVWMNPRFSKKAKFIISAAVIILTCLMTFCFVKVLGLLNSYYQQLLQSQY